jgi:hypothetical protein
VNLVAFVEQKFCQIASVLSGDAGDECFFQSILSVKSITGLATGQILSSAQSILPHIVQIICK